MTNPTNQPEVIKHQEYSLFDVFKAIQPYMKEEFSFDFDTNEGYPVQIGTVYSFHVIKNKFKHKFNGLSTEIPEDATPEETAALLEATSQIPVFKVPKTRRALAKEQNSNE